MRTPRLLLTLVIAAGACPPDLIIGAPIPGLFNTGVGANGALLANGAIDPHYRLVASPDASAPGPNAFVITDTLFPIVAGPWLASGPASKWIGPMANQSTGNLPGDYRYRLTFDLTGLEPASAVITGRWTSDNAGVGIFINGQPTGITYDGNFGAFSATFIIDAGFVEGTNTLDFVVNNAGTSANPTGFRAELTGTADPVSPPGTPPAITMHPVGISAGLGDGATFSVAATGARPLSYQWRRNSEPIAGATNATFTLASVSPGDAGAYDAVVSNPWGTATSTAAVLTVVYLSPAERTYEPAGASSRRTGLVFSEIMYHPREHPDGDNLEFIEIYNSNPFAEDISGYRISGDADFTFPGGTVIPGLGRLVVAPDPAKVAAAYGLAGVLGPLTNAAWHADPAGRSNVLPNSSATLRLRKASGPIVLEVTYSDEMPWPVAADGAGPSLVLVRPSFGEDDPRAWEASARVGGSPGMADPVPTGPLEHVVINEVLAHTDLPLLDFIELHNASPLAVNLSGCWLTDDPDTNKFRVPDGTELAAGGVVVFTEEELGFSLSAEGDEVLLVSPDQTRVLQAIRFGGQANGISWGRHPDGAPGFQELASRTPGQPNTPPLVRDIVINEIMYHPISEESDDEYVELYNRGATAVAVGGWALRDGISFTFPAGTTIPAGGYLVVARNAARLRAQHPTVPASTVVGDYSGSLADGGERIVLAMPEAVLRTNATTGIVTTNRFFVTVDEVTYDDGGRWSRQADGEGSSLELIDPRSDNRLAPNWAASGGPAAADWTTVETTGTLDLGHSSQSAADQLQVILQGAGEVLVDDVEVLVGGANRLANSNFESGLSGWFAQGTHRLTYWETNGGFNSARCLHLVASDRGDHVANRVRAPLTQNIPGGTANVTLRAKVRWLTGHPEILLRLKGGFLEAVGRLHVPSNLGTPGAPNSRARSNAGPAITDVSHRPVLPAPGVNIRVSARVQDPDGIGSVALRYRLDPATMLTTLPMRDDGADGDLVAGDGIFTASIPPQAQGALVAFHIVAQDAAAMPAATQFPAHAPVGEGLVRVGDVMPANAFGTYRFWITRANHDFWANREKMSNEDVDITFIYGPNRIVYNAGAHYSGSSYTAPTYTTPTGALCGYDITFPGDDTVLGEDHFTLDWPIRDDTDQREQLMFWFLEQYGLPNMYRRYVNLYVNGIRRGTIYDDVQQPGAETIEQWFEDDSEGNLYKTDCWNEFDNAGNRVDPCILNSLEVFLSGGVKKMARYRWNWRPRAIHGTANDFADLYALVDAMNAPGSAYQPAVNCVVDVDHWTRTFAMNDLASFWDAFGNPNAKNTYLYKPRRSGWKLMCWDFDVGLGVFNDPTDAPLFPSLGDPAMNRFHGNAAFVRGYWRALEEALNTFFRTGPGTAIDAILDSKYAAFQANGIALNSPAAIKTWINSRRAFLLGQLNTVAANFSVSGPDHLTTDRNLITITGTAPVRVEAILVNGVPYPTTWSLVGAAPVRWVVSVPLTAGTNVLAITGVGRGGEAIPGANRTITVEFLGADADPADFLVINEIMYSPVVPEASFIEILNTSPDRVFDLSGWRLNGADFTFAPGTLIGSRGFVVVTKKCAPFWSAYGSAPVLTGEFQGQLDDGGETISLIRPGGAVVDRVTYDDDPPWPAAADGLGASLQLIDPAQDNSRVSNWSDGAGWRFFSYTGNPGAAAANRLSLFLTNVAGDVYLDDLALVEGDAPGAGVNLIANGGFETGALSPWTASGLGAASHVSAQFAHSGRHSLHLVFASGAPALTHFFQDLTNVVSSGVRPSTVHTLSFWFLPGTNSSLFQARLNANFRLALDTRPVKFTPGAPNSGTAELPEYPPLWLSEVAPQAVPGVFDNLGEAEPWIELFNGGDAPWSLDGYYLATSFDSLTQWSFPADTVIGPGDYLLVWADGEGAETVPGQPHASFRPDPTNGIVVLSRQVPGGQQVVDYLSYRELGTGHSYGAFPPGQSSFRQEFFYPTAGGLNDPSAPPRPLFINEWMAANASFVRDPADQDFDDWFEIYNPNDEPVDLTGYRLTDTLANPNKFIVPANIVVPARGYLLVWADEESSQTRTNGDLHVNFRLSQSGEVIALYSPRQQLIDAVAFPAQADNVSHGRFPDGAPEPFVTMVPPTPGAANVVTALTSAVTEAGIITFHWFTRPAVTYVVQYKDSLDQAEWVALPVEVTAEGDMASFSEPATGRQRFYRVVEVR